MITTSEVGELCCAERSLRITLKMSAGIAAWCSVLATMAARSHVVCAPRGDYLAIITAYLPEPGEWQPGFRERKSR
jgi:hypothetical protein